MPLGYFCKTLSRPTKHPDQTDKPVELVNAQWRIEIEYKELAGLTGYKSWNFTGTENLARIEAKSKRKIFEDENSKNPIYICRLICTWVPDWYTRQYGSPIKDYWEDIR